MKTLKYLLVPFILPHLLCFVLISDKEKILADIDGYCKGYRFNNNSIKSVLLIKVLLFCPEFRNIFYKRITKISRKLHIGFLLEVLLPPYKFLSIGMSYNKIGKGLFIEHGNSTTIHAEVIGDNCWINQNVTLGDSGKGIPCIGNNVRIGTGAVVLGPIKVGDNVVIGANATIVKDVPADCTVVPSPSYIIKMNNQRVKIKL